MILYSNGNSQGASRRERERELRREAIIAAAQGVFAREGYFNATMAQIAAEAEFGMGTIYQFFPNKQGLFAEVIMVWIEAFKQGLREELATSTTWREKLSAFMDFNLSWVIKRPEIQRLVMEFVYAPIPDITPRIMARFSEAYIENIGLLQDILTQANTEGQGFDVELTAMMIMGTLNKIGNDWFLGRLTKHPTDYIPGIFAIICGG